MQNTRAELSASRQRIIVLINERSRLEKRLLKSKALLKGSLFEQYRKCSKSGCRCARGERHGPYPYLVVGKGKERRLTYVASKDYLKTKKRSENSKEFAAALIRVVRLNNDIIAEINNLRQTLESNL